MPIRPVGGEIRAQDINDNLSYIESSIKTPLNTALSSGEKVTMDLLAEDVKQSIAGTAPINDARGLDNNKGVTYPLLNLPFDGELKTVEQSIKDAVLSAKVIGAKRDKYYIIEWIGNGFLSSGVTYWGMQIAEYARTGNGQLDSSTRRQLLYYRNDNFPEPSNIIVSRTVDIPGEALAFEVTYDRSKFPTTALNISNGDTGRARGCVIHHDNYIYTSLATSTSPSTAGKKLIVDKKVNDFTVYRRAANGNYVGINVLFEEKALDTSVLSSNYKLWSIKSVKEYVGSGTTFTAIRTIIDNSATTMDTILRETTTTDYTGGLYHGDEVNEEAVLLIDGDLIPLAAVGTYQAEEVRLMQRNKLYRDNQYTNGDLQQIGTVGKEHIFNIKDGYKLSQTVKFSRAVTLTYAILGALPLYRTDENSNQLWQKFYTDISYAPYDITTATTNTPEEADVETVVVYGNNVKCVYKEERTNKLTGNRTWVNNTGSYAKLYNSFCPSGYTTKVNEQFKQSTSYYFDF